MGLHYLLQCYPWIELLRPSCHLCILWSGVV
jgi:hypothetical protein